jgi:ACR3 family arsenite efflux pump ArsB
MMYPILCKVRYESLHHVFRERGIWIQIAFSIFVNWIIAPFLMVSLLRLAAVKLANVIFPSSHLHGLSYRMSQSFEKV